MQTQMQTKTHDIVQRAKDERVWGIASSFDIYDCDPEAIRSADKIRDFVVKLCDLIEMKRFGETTVVHFGEDEKVAGFSMIQLIETSLISATWTCSVVSPMTRLWSKDSRRNFLAADDAPPTSTSGTSDDVDPNCN
jgi:hypothetical protein